MIDVRELSEWDEGHLGCATLLTLADLEETQIDTLTDGNTQVTWK